LNQKTSALEPAPGFAGGKSRFFISYEISQLLEQVFLLGIQSLWRKDADLDSQISSALSAKSVRTVALESNEISVLSTCFNFDFGRTIQGFNL
jgi:hypothetical protein